jgi:hypothetical protein
MATTAGRVPAASPAPWGAGRVVAVVLGSLGALLGTALLLAGLAVIIGHLTLRDADGFYTSSTERLTTSTPALTSEGLSIGHVDGPGAAWAADTTAARVRVRAENAGGRPIFVGIASERALDAYLRGVAHDEVTDVHSNPFSVDTVRRRGAGRASPPASSSIWAASATGPGTQTAEWKVEEGRWAVVVMNADGRPGVAADVSVGGKLNWLIWVGVALAVIGLVFLAGGGGLLYAGLRPRAAEAGGPPQAGAGGATAAPEAGGGATTAASSAAAVHAAEQAGAGYPVSVEGRLDEPLSRWLWLVKWLLAVPHWIVLAFLWLAVAVLWLVALVAIAATGRYPRTIFDFNLGVLRWTWRVTFYATNAIATDRYPPFTLAPADYPAELDVPYPEQLSRGKVLIKWWLLAIPHFVIVGLFLGGWSVSTVGGATIQPPGLLTVLVVFAGVALLFTGRYPRDIYDLVLGINRWILRVTAYVLLMRDEYPPFRLGR